MTEFRRAITRLMEERQERGAAAAESSPALRALFDHLRVDVSIYERPLLEGFARELFAKCEDLLVPADLPQLAAIARGAFRFVAARRAPLAVRVFRPTPERDDWTSAHTVIEASLDDRPFIVDTLGETIREAGGEILLLLHPILGLQRGADGTVRAVGPAGSLPLRESFVHAEAAHLEPSGELEELLASRLRDVIAVTDDYSVMRERSSAAAAELRSRRPAAPWDEEAEEAAAFLDWLADKSFVFLGYREYSFSGAAPLRKAAVRAGSGAGILREDARSRYHSPQVLSEEQCRLIDEPPLLLITKTSSRSPVHRLDPMDYIAVKQIDASGAVCGQRLLLGLFTSKAYREPSSAIPLLRRKLATIVEREEMVEGTHDYKDLVALFDSFPKEELFASDTEELRATLRIIRASETQTGARVLSRVDTLRRGSLVIVLVPRERFSTELHERISARLRQRLETAILHQHLALDEREQVRLHYYLTATSPLLEPAGRAVLEAELSTLLRTWEDQLQVHLAARYPPLEAERLAQKYAGAFARSYKASTDPAEAVQDVRSLEALAVTGRAQIEMSAAPGGDASAALLRLYLAGERLVLSDFIPVLENLGLRVLDESFIDPTVPGLERVRIHTFHVDSGETRADLRAAAPLLTEALHAIRSSEVPSDGLNCLLLRAGLDWRAVDLLRTYVEHARQSAVAERPAVVDALVSHPQSARLLFDLFSAKLDPAASSLPAAERLPREVLPAQQSFTASLDQVGSLAHDRILRALAAAVSATVRTNFFSARGERAEERAIAIKLDSRQLAHLRPPRPWREVYVHAAHMEGLHLRSGAVARGGIRLSDRPDDFRSEVLGLMKTQVVKNALIVPVGAKGGFVLARRRGGAPPGPAEIELAYRTLIHALLSLTDNVENGRVVPPPGSVVYDEGDPYLVVAADKGTATFSDTANEIALRRNFWLGDAFASGGSNGYDHKKLGITARGAWECVRRHFRELGRDADREPITVIGIGDMSGDVFGNGLLCSRRLRLLAAFNHLHIFLDPAPDPEVSFAERERLFRLPRSGWNDYDPARLGPGGGVYERAAKSIALSAAAREMLGIEAGEPSGEEVVKAILRMPADLLWNGGIGTYVKSSEQTHAEVGDSANDGVRVDASELRVKVVAEGGNLGFTQAARIEFALGGGAINTDAIDNSAGVDLSDHEVNLKIALQIPVNAREIGGAERNALLDSVAGAVCESVLSHNRRQARALGLERIRSRQELMPFRDLMTVLENETGMDRALEQLPTREVLRARRGAYLGLTRPELAVLLAHAKLYVRQCILVSALCDDPALDRFLLHYFPSPIVERFPHAARGHRLRREIVAVELANRLIDSMGMTFATRVAMHTGHEVGDVVRAWAAAVLIGDVDELIEQTDPGTAALSLEAEEQCCFAVEAALERASKWILQTQAGLPALGELKARFHEPVRALAASWEEVAQAGRAEAFRAEIERLSGLAVPADLARRIAALPSLAEMMEIAQIAAQLDAPLTAAGEVYFLVNTLVDIDWIRRSLSATRSEDRWGHRAIEGLLEGLLYARRQLAHDILLCRRGGGTAEDCLRDYAAAHAAQLTRLRTLIGDLKVEPQPSLQALLVVMRELGRLVGRV